MKFLQKQIRICYINTGEKTVDIFTNPLKKELFIYTQINYLDGGSFSLT